MSIYCPISEALGLPQPETPIKYSTTHYFDVKVPSPFKGQKHTEETKKLISESHKGKVYSEITIERMRKAKFGKKASVATKNKLSEMRKGKNNTFYGKSHSKESIEKNRKAHIGKKATEKTKEILSNQKLGRKWFNDGVNEYFSKIDNIDRKWMPGRLKRK